MYVFIHIPKTAGSAVMNVLRRTLNKRNVLHAGKPPETAALRTMSAEDLSVYKAVGAHMPYTQLLKLFGPSATYFSVMREPEARTISLWRHLARDPDRRGHAPAKPGLLPWLDFMSGNEHEREIASQRYFLQRDDGSIPDFPIGDQTELDAFLQSVLGPEAAEIWQLNTAKGEFEPSDEERARIREVFAGDFELWGEVRRRADARVSAPSGAG
ncbi:sulfotransferase family 2 domain-containing protein [Hyphomonas sp.]|uniref:sulfotransferase family 2 domain-containing protein n=1 Tax=Hyphomonas sp. TaxID=87 RepID=UPI0030FB9D22